MAVVDLLRRGVDASQRIAAGLGFIAPLATRLIVGAGFYLTGTGKWHNLDNVVKFFTSLGIPHAELQAPVVALLELVGGVCLVLGLFTRFFAAALAASMTVALATADKADFIKSLQYVFSTVSDEDWTKVPTDITSFAYLLLLLWLILYGAGTVSLDRLLGWLLHRGTAAGGTAVSGTLSPHAS